MMPSTAASMMARQRASDTRSASIDAPSSLGGPTIFSLLPERRTQRCLPRAISGRVAIGDKAAVTLVRMTNAAAVPDRAPILLGPGRDLADIPDDAVGVAAIQAVHAFERVQVPQLVAIDREVGAPPHSLEAPGAEAERLIERHREVEQHKGQREQIDERRRDDRQDVAASTGSAAEADETCGGRCAGPRCPRRAAPGGARDPDRPSPSLRPTAAPRARASAGGHARTDGRGAAPGIRGGRRP